LALNNNLPATALLKSLRDHRPGGIAPAKGRALANKNFRPFKTSSLHCEPKKHTSA